MLIDLPGQQHDNDVSVKRTAIYASAVLWQPSQDGNIRIPYRIKEKGKSSSDSCKSYFYYYLNTIISMEISPIAHQRGLASPFLLWNFSELWCRLLDAILPLLIFYFLVTSEEVFRIEIAIESFNQALNCDIKPWIARTNETEYIEFRKSSK